MSLFDPHRIYRKHYRKSHKGQIIQQRPVEEKTAISQQDIDKAVKIVRSLSLNTGRDVHFYVPFYGRGSFFWESAQIPVYNEDPNHIYLTVNNLLSQIPATDDFWSDIRNYLNISHSHLKDVSLSVLMRSMHFTAQPKSEVSGTLEVYWYPRFPEILTHNTYFRSSMGTTTEIFHIIPTLTSTTTGRYDYFEVPYDGSRTNAAVTTLNLDNPSPTGSLSVITITGMDANDLFTFLQTKRVPEATNEHVNDIGFRQVSASESISYEMNIYTTFDVIIDGTMTI